METKKAFILWISRGQSKLSWLAEEEIVLLRPLLLVEAYFEKMQKY